MKKLILTLLFTSLPLSFTYAQEKVKVREVGLITSDLNNFGFTFRKGNQRSVFRFNAFTTSLSSNDITDNINDDKFTRSNFDFGLRIGKEWRTSVSEKLEIRTGFDLGYSYSQQKDERLDPATQSVVIEEFLTKSSETGVNFVFGFNFLFGDGFVLGGEVLPGYYYRTLDVESKLSTVTNVIRTEEGATFDLSTSSLRLSLLYRF